MSEIYDVVVVGAGVEGSAAAYNLAKRGKRTLLLEQFPLPHSRGSSHGQSRITRKAYPQDFYTEMMHEATDVWRQLESDAGWEIFKQTGYLAIGPYKGTFLEENATSLTRNKAQFEYLSPPEFRRRFPMLSYPDNFGGIVDPDGGILRADKALRAYHTMFLKYGGKLVDGARVTKISRGPIVTLETPSATYRGKSVIICAGPWASSILKPLGVRLPLEAVRISACYWRELRPGTHTSSNLPTFVDVKCCDGIDIYGLPSDEYPGHVKTVRINVLYWPERRSGSHHSSLLPTFYDDHCCGGFDIYGLPSEEYPGQVKIVRISVLYWRELTPGDYDVSKIPSFSEKVIQPIYGTPSLEYPGHMKICLHHGPVIDPESRDQADDKWVIELTKGYVRDHFPWLEATPSVVETCIYTNTPDKHPVLDYIPGSRNIVVGAGFSGHGFKLSPVVGKVLGELALGERPSYSLTPFRVSRFPAQASL